MKTKFIIIGLLAILLSNCKSPEYLPSSDKIDVNQYGSYIDIALSTSGKIAGELISIDSTKLVVLTEDTKKCVIVPVNDISKFKLRYALSKHYGWYIPLFLLTTIGHGAFAGLSIPVNLIVTISVTASGEKAFTYRNRTISYSELMMFARFPQGIPPNINPENIR